VRQVIGEANYAKCRPYIAAVLRGEPQDYTETLSDPAGRCRWVHAQYVPQHDEMRQVVGFIAQVDDVSAVKRAEAELRERETFLNQAAAIAKIGFFIWDDDNGGCQFCSEQLAVLWGMSVEQYGETMRTDQMILERIHPEDRDSVHAVYDETTRRPGKYTIEFRAYDSQGQLRYLQERGQGTCDESGRVRRVIGTVKDVTERRLTEAALRRTAERLAEAQRIGSMGNWEWNVGTGEIRWSDQVYRLFGHEPQAFQATYEGFLSCVHPDDREAVKTAVQRSLEDKSHYTIDHRIVLPDDQIRIERERGEAFYDADGRPLRMVGTVQDITDLAEAQNEAERQGENARAIMEHVADELVTIDARGTIRDFNPAAVASFGYGICRRRGGRAQRHHADAGTASQRP